MLSPQYFEGVAVAYTKWMSFAAVEHCVFSSQVEIRIIEKHENRNAAQFLVGSCVHKV